jgi:hypothetical protein
MSKKMPSSEADFTPKYSCRNISKKIEANVELNVEHNENGRLIGARKVLILKVGTAGFEPTASCTPTKCATFSGLFLNFLGLPKPINTCI